MEFLSLLALVIVIALSCFSELNPGLLSLGLAWALGYYGAHMSLDQIAAGFPIYLFTVLVGVTYLFGLAKHNGTLERLAQVALGVVKNNAQASPLLFFILAALLSTVGAGNIGTVALLAPIAMAVAWETGIGAFFMTVILICGANAGTFSPFALTGIIANSLIAKLGLVMEPWQQVFLPNFFAQTVLAVLCALLFYWQMRNRPARHHVLSSVRVEGQWSMHQRVTLAAILILISATLFLKTDIGFLSILLASVLTLFNVGDGKETIKQMPWNTILMVCGVNTLIGVLENLGGLNLLTSLLAKISTPQNVTAVTAFVTGTISAFSSSSGVVLPTFIPLVPDLITKMGGGNPVSIVSSINVGAHLVDISPLSSLGALCVASAIHEDRDKLFRHLLGFGLSMAIVGAIICYLLFGLIN